MKEIKMCQMTVMGMGYSNNANQTMAMVLQEIEAPHRKMPVFLPKHREESFVSLVKWHARNEHNDHDVVDDLAMAIGYKIRSVSIHTERSGALTAQMMALGELGERVTFTVTMHQGVLHAYLRDLPIYVEEKILVTAERQVEYKGEDDVPELGIDTHKERVRASKIGRWITHDIKPEDVSIPIAISKSREASDSDLEILHDLSLSREQYEWAQIIWNEQERRKQGLQDE